jgi:hypothetical protein
MHSEVLKRILQPEPKQFLVPGSTPVISFGDFTTANLLTLSINPSSNEFRTGSRLLPVEKKRLVDKELLGITNEEPIREFHAERIWDGCRDYSMAVALPELLDWWAKGDLLINSRIYCRELLNKAVELLSSRWETRSHMNLDEGCYSHMACVELPRVCLPPGAILDENVVRCTSTHSKMLQDALHFAFKIEVPVKTLPSYSGDSRSYVRISAMIYNSLEEYRRLADAVLQIRWTINAQEEVELMPI